MAHVIADIELTNGDRALVMGGKPGKDDNLERVSIRLVFCRWVDTRMTIPLVHAEVSKRRDALGNPVWESADGLPLPIVLSALGDAVRNSRPGHEAPTAEPSDAL